LLDLAGHARRDLLPPDKLYLTRPRFSPDGKSIAYLRQTSLSTYDLYIVAATGGSPRALSQGSVLSGFGWEIDGRSLAAVGSSSGNKPQLWRFPMTGGAANRVAELDAGRGSGLSLSRNKGSLAWVRDLNANSLWRMPVDQYGGPPRMLANSAALDIDADLSSDGRIVFRSDRSGVTELWVANADGTSPRQATQFRGAFVGDAHWSPDGRSIAFTSHAKGNPDIFVMRCDRDAAGCGAPRQLTQTHSSDANPTWSADGRWIYFSSDRSGEFEVWRMRAEGEPEPVRITWTGGYVARESADGKWLYYSKLWQSRGFWRIALPARGPGQAEIPVKLDIPFSAGATWALGRRELFYYPSTNDPAVPFPAVRAVDLQTGHARDLPLGNIRLGRGLALSPDEHWLLRSQNDRDQTLVMIAE
jgi:Tol biopolymer transport system component